MGEKPRQQEREAVGQITSPSRKQRTMNVDVQLACLSPSNSQGPYPHATHSRGGASLLSKSFLETVSLTHPELCLHGNPKFSQAELTVKINYHKL